MKKAHPFYTVVIACSVPWVLWPAGALAQSQAAQNSPSNALSTQVKCEPRDPKDARSNDLRTALQQQRQKCDDASEANVAGRHLSTQEKAQLREQLRQQR